MTKNDIDKIIASVKLGVDLEIAVHAQGQSIGEVFHWLERGKSEEAKIAAGMKPTRTEAKYLSFWKEVKTARAESIAAIQMSIRHAALEDWKAGAWWLEKTMPEKYGKQAEQLSQVQDQLKELESDED